VSRSSDLVFDFSRAERIGFAEAVLCEGKSPRQLIDVVNLVSARSSCILMTRLDPTIYGALPDNVKSFIDFDAESRTGIVGTVPSLSTARRIAIVAAGTSDFSVVRETERTLNVNGHEATRIVDVGVAGLWRLMQRLDEIRDHQVVIAVAGMDAALPTVLGGLIASPIISVPTSTGYGAAEAGRTALNAMLASCTSGLSVVNIDNGFGAACAALRILRLLDNVIASSR
jgi:pyridinium-3,5-biscarboxylic acid mononucleotide synthase